MLWTALHRGRGVSYRPMNREESHGTGHDDWFGHCKSVFQVHGVDAEGGVVLRRRLTRARMLPFFAKLGPCKIGI